MNSEKWSAFEERPPVFPTRDPEATTYQLCKIKAAVHEHLGYQFASDCICRDRPDDYRESGDTLDFLESSVKEKIAREADGGKALIDRIARGIVSGCAEIAVPDRHGLIWYKLTWDGVSEEARSGSRLIARHVIAALKPGGRDE